MARTRPIDTIPGPMSLFTTHMPSFMERRGQQEWRAYQAMNVLEPNALLNRLRAEPKLVSGGKLATDAADAMKVKGQDSDARMQEYAYGKERFDVTFSTEGIRSGCVDGLQDCGGRGDLLAKKGASRNPLTLACYLHLSYPNTLLNGIIRQALALEL